MAKFRASSVDGAKRALAEFEIRSAEQSRLRIQEQHDSGARWLLASLFAINSGSVVGIIGSDQIELMSVFWPIVLYFAGVISSIVMGAAVQISDRKMVAAVHSWGQFWTVFLETGMFDAEAEAEAKLRIQKAESIGRIGRKSGLVSMLCWLIGSVWLLYLIGFDK